MQDEQLYELAELSDIFAEAAMAYLDEYPDIGRAVDESLTPEEIAEQRRLLQGRTFPWGFDPAQIDQVALAEAILGLNENITRFVMRCVGMKALNALVPADSRSEEASRGFTERGYPMLAQMFAPL